MKKLFFSSITILVLVSACSIFQKDSFEGSWEIKLSGSISETIAIVILPDYSFSANKIIPYSGQEFDVNIKGKVEQDGKLEAEIIVSGQPMGQIKGILNYENGKGNWGANILSGEWTAVKK